MTFTPKTILCLGTAFLFTVGAAMGPSFAQETAPADAPVSQTAEGAALAEFTPETVDPADPFGDIDVTTAGATEEEAKTFFEGLQTEQQAEIEGRCGIILNPVHQERYAEETASVLCRNLLGAGLIEASEGGTPAQ